MFDYKKNHKKKTKPKKTNQQTNQKTPVPVAGKCIIGALMSGFSGTFLQIHQKLLLTVVQAPHLAKNWTSG